MTDTDKVCRVMSDAIFKELENIGFYYGSEELAEIIRNHTVVPEMLEFIGGIENWDQHHQLRVEAKEILEKAEGK